jgi:hypothetical protein
MERVRRQNMTKRELVISWLRWFETNINVTIETLIEETKEDEVNPDWITHHLEENILQDLRKLERGLKKDIEKWVIKKVWEDKNEN